MANYKTTLSTNTANWITTNPSCEPITAEADGKYVTKSDITINNLLQKSKCNTQSNYKDSPSQTDTINIDDYCSFIHLLENRPKVKQISKSIITLLSSNKAFHNDTETTQKLHQLVIHNYYFEDVLNSLLRRIEYHTSSNQFISEDMVMNMLYEEAETLKRKTDTQMEKYCHIKNFSSTIVIDNKRLQLLPLINSLNAKFYKGQHKHKGEIYTTQLDKEHNNELGDVHARLERLNEKKRVTIKRRVKKMIMNDDGEMVEGDSFETVIEEIEVDDNGYSTNENWFNNIGKVSYWYEFNKHQNDLIAQGIIETNNRLKARMKGNVDEQVNKNQSGKEENKTQVDMINAPNGSKVYVERKEGSVGRKWIMNNQNNNTIINKGNAGVTQYGRTNELFSIGKGVQRFGGIFGKKENGKDIRTSSIDNSEMKGELSLLFKKYDAIKPRNSGNHENTKTVSDNKGEPKEKSALGDNTNEENNNELHATNGGGGDKKEFIHNISPSYIKNKRVKSLDKVSTKRSSNKPKNKSRSNKTNEVKQREQNKDNDKDIINKHNNNKDINDNNRNNHKQTNKKGKTKHHKISSNKSHPNQQINHTKHIILDAENTLNNNNTLTMTHPDQRTQYNTTNQETNTKYTSEQAIINAETEVDINHSENETEQSDPHFEPSLSGAKHKHRKNKFSRHKDSKNKSPDKTFSSFKSPPDAVPKQPSDLSHQSQIHPRKRFKYQTMPSITLPVPEVSLDLSLQTRHNRSNYESKTKLNEISSSLCYIDNSRRSTFKGPKLTLDNPQSRKVLKHIPRKDSGGNYFLRLKEEEKLQQRNEYLYKERQRRLAEEKKKRLLGRLSNSQEPAFRHLVSFEAKLKDLNLVEKIKHQLFAETTEEGKQRFLDMLNQINKLKDVDVNQYVQDLEKELDPIQEEIDAIIKAKLVEERLNKFINTFSDFRKRQINKRSILSDNFKVIDNKFKTTMSDNMHFALNKKTSIRNVTYYK